VVGQPEQLIVLNLVVSIEHSQSRLAFLIQCIYTERDLAAVLLNQKSAEQCELPGLTAVAEASANNFVSGNLDSGIASRIILLRWLPEDDLDGYIVSVTQDCVAGIEEYGKQRKE